MDRLYQLLVTMEMTPPNGHGLYVDGCVSVLIGQMSEDRLALIRTVNYNLPIHYSITHSVCDLSSTIALMLIRVAL